MKFNSFGLSAPFYMCLEATLTVSLLETLHNRSGSAGGSGAADSCGVVQPTGRAAAPRALRRAQSAGAVRPAPGEPRTAAQPASAAARPRLRRRRARVDSSRASAASRAGRRRCVRNGFAQLGRRRPPACGPASAKPRREPAVAEPGVPAAGRGSRPAGPRRFSPPAAASSRGRLACPSPSSTPPPSLRRLSDVCCPSAPPPGTKVSRRAAAEPSAAADSSRSRHSVTFDLAEALRSMPTIGPSGGCEAAVV